MSEQIVPTSIDLRRYSARQLGAAAAALAELAGRSKRHSQSLHRQSLQHLDTAPGLVLSALGQLLEWELKARDERHHVYNKAEHDRLWNAVHEAPNQSRKGGDE